MASLAPEKNLEELTLGSGVRLEDLVDRDALAEMVKSFYELFSIPLRILSEEGKLLADASGANALYAYLNTFAKGRLVLGNVVTAVRAVQPEAGEGARYICVTGAFYQVYPIQYDGRTKGRVILGPFTSEQGVPAASLFELDPQFEREKIMHLFAELPRMSNESIARLALHLNRTLDLVLFSGHRALITTNMHLASVRESFRELEEKNNQLVSAYERLKELDRLKSNFLATVSHELKTPLTSILGYSEMLVEGLAGEMSAEQREFVQTIHDKGEQLLGLIKSLLDLTKLESGMMSMKKGYVDVNAVVRDVLQTLMPAARKKGVQLTADVEYKLPNIWADAERLRQILLNLTENALKFTPPEGRVTLSSKLTAVAAPPMGDSGGHVILNARRTAVELRVADTGIGIPLAERERVFDPFYQVDSSSTREQGGTGLGLSIVRRLVEGHDGTVRIEDNTPTGTQMIVTIPSRRATIG